MLADALVIGVVVLFVIIGYKAGFMKSLINIVSYIISFILSFLFYPVVSGFLLKTPLYPYLKELINKNYVSESIQMPQEGVFGVLSKYLGNGLESAAEGISGSVAQLIIDILAFVLVVILFKIIIKVVGNLLNIFTKLPVIKQFNRFGGMLLGGLAGVVVLYIAFALMVVVAPINADSKMMNEIDKSMFASEMYQNNVVLDFIDGGRNGD